MTHVMLLGFVLLSYRKVGGLHFITVDRFGMSFYIRRAQSAKSLYH